MHFFLVYIICLWISLQWFLPGGIILVVKFINLFINSIIFWRSFLIPRLYNNFPMLFCVTFMFVTFLYVFNSSRFFSWCVTWTNAFFTTNAFFPCFSRWLPIVQHHLLYNKLHILVTDLRLVHSLSLPSTYYMLGTILDAWTKENKIKSLHFFARGFRQ